MANKNLHAAKKAKQDEFYTQWADIEREMTAYLEYDPDVFRDKTILLPCDDPAWSNFTKFFALRFTEFGIKKLISTAYAPEAKGVTDHQPTLFELEDEKYDESKSRANGKVFVLTREDISGDGVVNIDDLQWDYLEGDGDFRSAEVTALRDEADLVITNPPFSLFREFMAWLMDGGVQFAVIGSQNAITYKEVFPLIKEGRVWTGTRSGGMAFRVPEGAPQKSSQTVVNGERFQKLGNVCWFTNLEHGRRHERLDLMTMEDNLRFSRKEKVREQGYPKYDNYDAAIEVPFTECIPSDYEGVMGVPIAFIDKFNTDQFEIVGLCRYTAPKEVLVGGRLAVNGSPKYARILIRHLNPETSKGAQA